MPLCAAVQVKYGFYSVFAVRWCCYVNGERVSFAVSVDSSPIFCMFNKCAAGLGSAVVAVCALEICTDYPDTFCSLMVSQNDVHRVSKCLQYVLHFVFSN